MASLWNLGGLTWKELTTRVWAEMIEDDIFGHAAQLAYYFLLALFPLLLFLTSLLGLFAKAGSDVRHSLFVYLATVMPSSSFEMVQSTVDDIGNSAGGGKISFGILAALWAASNGLGAITDSLNVAYHVEDSRPWWKRRLIAIALTIALGIFIISALTLTLYGEMIASLVAARYGLGDLFTDTWNIVQWPIVLVFVLLAFALIYFLAPDLKRRWRWATPGAVVAVLLWLLVSFGLRVYLHFFNSYSATYGSLGAVIILMLWFYLTGAAILIGGEINSEIEDAAARSGRRGANPKKRRRREDESERSGG